MLEVVKANDSNGDRWRDGGEIKSAQQRKAGTMKSEREERDEQRPIDCKSHEHQKRSTGTSSQSKTAVEVRRLRVCVRGRPHPESVPVHDEDEAYSKCHLGVRTCFPTIVCALLLRFYFWTFLTVRRCLPTTRQINGIIQISQSIKICTRRF